MISTQSETIDNAAPDTRMQLHGHIVTIIRRTRLAGVHQQLSRTTVVGVTVAPEPHLEARAPALRHGQRCVVVLAAAREEHEPASARLDQRACREPRVATVACHLFRVGVGVDLSPG